MCVFVFSHCRVDVDAVWRFSTSFFFVSVAFWIYKIVVLFFFCCFVGCARMRPSRSCSKTRNPTALRVVWCCLFYSPDIFTIYYCNHVVLDCYKVEHKEPLKQTINLSHFNEVQSVIRASALSPSRPLYIPTLWRHQPPHTITRSLVRHRIMWEVRVLRWMYYMWGAPTAVNTRGACVIVSV